MGQPCKAVLYTADAQLPLQAVQTGTVISSGVGTDLSVQSLYSGSYNLLSTNVHYGLAKQPYAPSGAGPKASSFYTLWNTKVSMSCIRCVQQTAEVMRFPRRVRVEFRCCRDTITCTVLAGSQRALLLASYVPLISEPVLYRTVFV